MLGKIFKTNGGTNLKVLENKNSREVLIEFQDEFKFRRYVRRSSILSGGVKNPYAKTVCGVGMIGEIKNGSSHILYSRWKNMIRRCYDVKDKDYLTYGAKGVTISEEWKVFANYVNDVEKMSNYDNLVSNPLNWEIDKDLSGQNVYSSDSCIIIKKKDNLDISSEKLKVEINQYGLDDKYIKTFNSITEAAEELNVNRQGIVACLNNRSKTAYGYKWKYKNTKEVR